MLSHQPIAPQNLVLAWRLAASSAAVEKGLNLLSVHGLALSLLDGELGKVFTPKGSYAKQLNRQDKLLAYKARDILLDEFKNPPLIA